MATRLIALAIVALTFIPLANWLPGGEVDPEYGARTIDWLLGATLCVGVAGLAMYVARTRGRAQGATDGGTGVPDATSHQREVHRGNGLAEVGTAGSGFAWSVSLGAGLLYALIAQIAFSGRPLLIDEIVQVLQARWYAEGRLWVPTPSPREFFSIMHLVDLGPRTFGQFPAGGPAMLALGSLVGAEWLVGPMVGTFSVRLFAELLRGLEPTASRAWHRGALVLFAVAPFGAFMFGSHMNHATTLVWLLVAVVGIERATRQSPAGTAASPAWGLVVGMGVGMAATIRPLDGAAFAVPAAGWLLWRARHGGPPLLTLVLSGVGVAGPIGGLLWGNAQTTGAPFLFGYEQLWGAEHALGFHPAPWGPPHTPSRGFELLSVGIARLSTYLFETPFPALMPAAVGLWGLRRLAPLDRFLLSSSGLLLGGYWAYWHDGLYLGPRFYFPLFPIAIVWSARSVFVLHRWIGTKQMWHIGLRVGAGFGALYAVVTILVVRLPQYTNNMLSIRMDVGAAADAAGVRDAVVLVQESWGAQVLARLWALGIPRSAAEQLYRTTGSVDQTLSYGCDHCSAIHRDSSSPRIRPIGGSASFRARHIHRPALPDLSANRVGSSTSPRCDSYRTAISISAGSRAGRMRSWNDFHEGTCISSGARVPMSTHHYCGRESNDGKVDRRSRLAN